MAALFAGRFRAQSRSAARISGTAAITEDAPGYATVNLAVARTFVAGPAKLRAFLRIDDVLNARYIGSVIVNEADGRAISSQPPAAHGCLDLMRGFHDTSV